MLHSEKSSYYFFNFKFFIRKIFNKIKIPFLGVLYILKFFSLKKTNNIIYNIINIFKKKFNL